MLGLYVVCGVCGCVMCGVCVVCGVCEVCMVCEVCLVCGVSWAVWVVRRDLCVGCVAQCWAVWGRKWLCGVVWGLVGRCLVVLVKTRRVLRRDVCNSVTSGTA